MERRFDPRLREIELSLFTTAATAWPLIRDGMDNRASRIKWSKAAFIAAQSARAILHLYTLNIVLFCRLQPEKVDFFQKPDQDLNLTTPHPVFSFIITDDWKETNIFFNLGTIQSSESCYSAVRRFTAG